ncbi:putative leucine-rich repeat receptor-like protein kinase [Morus notabilis]|uniref:Putative leucine-rich repeat receptor-like protein kinase n=1 Tax=Morus notabilis TaxID=981085 RepID=W9RSK4_9ROSA|nr:putative leucine-rich repeat receptor-like protein kinase [Morus notabilis]
MTSPCTWYGIHCNHFGSVTKINLTSSGLKGTLHEFKFSSFPYLAYLDLSMNSLFGTIPPKIGHLSKLMYLDPSTNQFYGKFPVEICLLLDLEIEPLNSKYRNLLKLHYVNLSDNELNSGIPVQLGKLVQLSQLDLSHNYLSREIPTEFSNLQSLLTLNLSHNRLSGAIPESFQSHSRVFLGTPWLGIH